MKLNFYVVYDKKAKCYNDPVLFVNDAVAERALYSLGCDHNFIKFAEDYQLICIGSYDQETGALVDDGIRVVLDDFTSIRKKGVSCEGAMPPESTASVHTS